MRKALKSTLAAMMALTMFLALTACNKTPDSSSAQGNAELAGSYFVDLAPSGMPMVIYLHIQEDNSFMLSNKFEDGGDNKGSGNVGGKDGTYMLLYDEDDKSATFTVDADGNLEFSTRLPYGTSNIGFDDANIVAVKVLPNGSNLPSAGPPASMAAQFAGKYGIDLAPHGMPMMVYLFIEEDGSFTLYDKYEDGTEKGKGTLEVAMGSLALVYDSGERLGFTSEDDTLTFDGKLPYGDGMTLGSDDAAVEAVKLPDDYTPEGGGMGGMGAAPGMPGTIAAGTYFFEEKTQSDMMGETVYQVTLELKEGDAFTVVSVIETSKGPSESEFSGTYTVDGATLTLNYQVDGEDKTAAATATAAGIEFDDPGIFFVMHKLDTVVLEKTA